MKLAWWDRFFEWVTGSENQRLEAQIFCEDCGAPGESLCWRCEKVRLQDALSEQGS